METKDESDAPVSSAASPPSPQPGTDAVGSVMPNVAFRSEGQRLLRGVSASLAEVARQVGAKSKQSVSDWREGKQVPGPAFRVRLSEVYGIPLQAWSELAPGVPVEPVQMPRIAKAAPSTVDECVALLESVRDQRRQKGLMPSEVQKLYDTETRILALKHRMERDAELLEDRVVRQHPMWHRIRRVIAKALGPHPAAARAVAAALEALDGGE